MWRTSLTDQMAEDASWWLATASIGHTSVPNSWVRKGQGLLAPRAPVVRSRPRCRSGLWNLHWHRNVCSICRLIAEKQWIAGILGTLLGFCAIMSKRCKLPCFQSWKAAERVSCKCFEVLSTALHCIGSSGKAADIAKSLRWMLFKGCRYCKFAAAIGEVVHAWKPCKQ